ncbi:MAG: hypothetical protein HY553_16845 [Elusimicrobia bacterium]|nr:hypothetical protein [Elusimicrobiota bacterium]
MASRRQGGGGLQTEGLERMLEISLAGGPGGIYETSGDSEKHGKRNANKRARRRNPRRTSLQAHQPL